MTSPFDLIIHDDAYHHRQQRYDGVDENQLVAFRRCIAHKDREEGNSQNGSYNPWQNLWTFERTRVSSQIVTRNLVGVFRRTLPLTRNTSGSHEYCKMEIRY